MRKLNQKKVTAIKEWNKTLYNGSKKQVLTCDLWSLYYKLVNRQITGIYAGSGVGTRALWACLEVGTTDNLGVFHPGSINDTVRYYKKHIK